MDRLSTRRWQSGSDEAPPPMIFNEVIGCFVFLLCVTLAPVDRSVGSRVFNGRGGYDYVHLFHSRGLHKTQNSRRDLHGSSRMRGHIRRLAATTNATPLSISSLNPKPFVESAADNRCINVQQRRYDMLIPHVPESRLSIHPSIHQHRNIQRIHTHTHSNRIHSSTFNVMHLRKQTQNAERLPFFLCVRVFLGIIIRLNS